MKNKKLSSILTVTVTIALSSFFSVATAEVNTQSADYNNGLKFGLAHGALTACQIFTNEKLPGNIRDKILSDSFSIENFTNDNPENVYQYLNHDKYPELIEQLPDSAKFINLRATNDYILGFNKGSIWGFSETRKEFRPGYKFDNVHAEMERTYFKSCLEDYKIWGDIFDVAFERFHKR
jgi:hypothetical protein